MPRAILLLRSRLPALCLAALFHVVLIALLLRAIPRQTPPHAVAPETQLVFVPLPQPLPKHMRRRREEPGGSGAITAYVNPYTFDPQALQSLEPQRRLGLALASCAPENYDRQSDEVRAACSRIQTVLAYDKEHFGVTVDYRHGQRWQAELIARNRPILAPCMSPGGVDVLYLLGCVYQVLFIGYDSDTARHY